MNFASGAARAAAWAMAALHYTPGAAWALTPREWHAAYHAWCALHGLSEGAAATRQDLQKLMKDFPDGGNAA